MEKMLGDRGWMEADHQSPDSTVPSGTEGKEAKA